MNKELKTYIDSMDDEEKYNYRASLQFLEKIVDIIGVAIILFIFMIPGLFIILAGTVGVIFFSIVGSTMKQTRIYIEEKLKLR